MLLFFWKSDFAIAKVVKNKLPHVLPLILSINQINEGIQTFGTPQNFLCKNENFKTQEFAYSSLSEEDNRLSFLNLIESLINNSEVDKQGRTINQVETNIMLEKCEQLRLESEDYDKILKMIAKSKRISLKDRAHAIGIVSDIQIVKKQMNEYLDLGNVRCYFLYDNNMKNNLGEDSIFYHHEKLSKIDQDLFDPNDFVITIVGRCKGRGLLGLPEFQTQR